LSDGVAGLLVLLKRLPFQATYAVSLLMAMPKYSPIRVVVPLNLVWAPGSGSKEVLLTWNAFDQVTPPSML
jgi:hypothetical protein